MNNKARKAIVALLLAALAACVGALCYVLIHRGSGKEEETEQTKALQGAARLAEDGDTEGAIAEYEKIIEEDPSCADAYEGIALAYGRRQDALSAVHWLGKGVDRTGSEELGEMLEEYRLVFGVFGGETYPAEELSGAEEGVAIYDDLLRTIATYTYKDYSESYTFSAESSESVKYVNELPLTLNFNGSPKSDSQPESVVVRDVKTLFVGYSRGLSYGSLGGLGAENISLSFCADLGADAVRFEKEGCTVRVESDKNGNIVLENPSNVVLPYVSGEGSGGEGGGASDELRTMKGFVLNARNDSPVGGATVEFYSGSQSENKGGKPVAKAITNTQGDYSVKLAPGEYCAKITSPDYVPLSEDIAVRKNENVTVRNFYLTKKSDVSGRYRFVMKSFGTDSQPRSFLRFVGRSEGNAPCECYYGAQTVKNDNGDVAASLEINEQDGQYSETVTIFDASDRLVYYVRSVSGAPLKDCGVEIEIYIGDSDAPAQVVKLPSDKLEGKDIWYAVDITDGSAFVVNSGETDLGFAS